MATPFEQLSDAEQILAEQDMWDRMAERHDVAPIDKVQMRELLRVLADADAHPEDSMTWEEFRASMRTWRRQPA